MPLLLTPSYVIIACHQVIISLFPLIGRDPVKARLLHQKNVLLPPVVIHLTDCYKQFAFYSPSFTGPITESASKLNRNSNEQYVRTHVHVNTVFYVFMG